jgi:hypothetical protein
MKKNNQEIIDLDLTEQDFYRLARLAHEKDITFNQLCEQILEENLIFTLDPTDYKKMVKEYQAKEIAVIDEKFKYWDAIDLLLEVNDISARSSFCEFCLTERSSNGRQRHTANCYLKRLRAFFRRNHVQHYR